MLRIVPDDRIARWVYAGADEEAPTTGPDPFPDGYTVAIRNEHGEMLAGVVYHDFRNAPDGTPWSCEMSIRSRTPRWASRRILKELFEFPFGRLELRRVTAQTTDIQVAAFLSRLGFQLEGEMRQASPANGGSDVLLFSMLPGECPWR